MGTVYLARDLRLDRPVALKILLPEFAAQPGLRDRFLRETRTAASFSHPNIVPVYAVEEGEDYLAYAMGLVEGETLTARVARAGPLPVRELVRVLQDVGYALAYAHGRGVVHRDIKPDNIMIERATGRALVLDFGISRSMTAALATATNLTRVGEVVGTPEYMSPEQATGDVVDGRSDLYSLGLAAHFAVTGRTAVTGENTQKILARQLTEPLPPIAELRPDLPRPLAEAIDQCVRKDPADRFQRAEELVEQIDAAQLAEPEIPLPIRLLAGELSTLTLAAWILLLLTWLVARGQQRANVSDLDLLLPVVGLLAILFARVLTSMGEVRRLAEAGYTADDVVAGLRLVMRERATRRDELRADARTVRRRRDVVRWSAGLLVLAVAMMYVAWNSRVAIRPGYHSTPPIGIVLVFAGLALFGVSMVVLMRSPLRMTPGERIFRYLWLGPLGRAFVRLSMRGAEPARVGGPMSALGTAERMTREAGRSGASVPSLSRPAPDPHARLEARVAELERWRRTRGE